MYNGKHKFSGDWVYGYYRNNEVGGCFITEVLDEFENYVFQEFEVQPNTVGQYTGLKDNHKNEIFEGDKVLFNDDEVGIIVWDNKESCWILQEDTICYPLGNFYDYELEVIGNIYEEDFHD